MKLAVFALCTFTAFGQAPPKQNSTIQLANTPSNETVKRMTAIVGLVARIPDVSFDESHSSFALRGPENQLNLAAWLLHAMDRPAGWQPQDSGAADNEYVLQPGGYALEDKSPITRIHYLRNSDRKDAVEMVAAIRVVARIPDVVNSDRPRMIVVRGTATDANLADWIIQKLDLPAAARASAALGGDTDANKFNLPPRTDGTEDTVEVFYLNPNTNMADNIKLRNNIGQTTNTTTVFNKISPPAIVIRGTSSLLAQTRQIIDGFTASRVP